ncbi:outer membrane protein assembly factor BamA [Amaricoccus sp.]|uniref:outer membrane protein assembly factor BamA n=1 Tax=Amaricoccus sp. TaxID=1872485 RepID=UPI002D0074C8|nr:outer membrane protein assembly factor BamA [Amaricoccus sp.]HRW14193.1 outer membrane protein assembly factor BamA [Amaricoccus sp.]
MGQRQWMRAILRLCVVVAVLVTVLPSPLTQAQGTAVFSRIDVAGNERIEADTVRVFSGIEPGEPVTPEELNLAVRRLFDTGLFEDVTVMPQAGRLVITVVENPTINQIAFEGNNSIDDEELTKVVELRPRLAYSVAAAEADAQRIVEAYRQSGRFSASVNPVIIRQSDNRVDLVFEIFEGRSTQVQRVSFTGNEAFSDRRLRRVIQTNQANWLSFLFGGTNYDADRLELDRELLRQFYLQRGYVDFRVLSSTAELSRERNGFFLSFTVSEGAQYRFGQIRVASAIPGLDATAFEPLLGPVLGNGVYNVKNVDTVIERMTFQAGQQGYAFVDIRPIVDKDEANRIVNITFEMTPGERVFVERIDITGNTRTLDRVIRRQFDIVEGDAFNAREIRDAEDQIRGLGYFSTATVSVREGTTPDRALVLVEVEEQSTGSLNLGGAYSTNEGLTAQIGIVERNFLGRGQTVSATIAANKEFGNFEFGFVEPALFDRDLLAGFSLYYRQRDFSEQTFQQSNAGFEPRIGYPLSENGRIVWRYRLSQDDIYNLADNTSRIIFAEEGSLITSAIGATYAYDRRNSVVDPTAGFIMTLNQEFAGLGGDVTHSKTRGTARVYSSLFDEQVVLSAELEGGAIFSDQGTRITDRFNAGGDSFRGFARNGLGPRDECDVGQCLPPQQNLQVDESLGGNYYGILRLDASFPLGLPEEYGIYGGVFGDVGSLWGLDDTDGSMGQVDASMHLRSAVGVSLFVDTPFAPLRFNYAVPIKKVDTDVVERFRFSIESRF